MPALINADEHLDADDLLARMKTKQRKVSRATVYRTFKTRSVRLAGTELTREIKSAPNTKTDFWKL